MGGIGGAALGSSVSGIVSTLIRQKLELGPGVVVAGVAVSMAVGLVFASTPRSAPLASTPSSHCDTSRTHDDWRKYS